MSDKIDRKAFKAMEYASTDKTNVDFLSKPDRVGSKDVHNMLMAAGFTPGLGNIADAADALLYATEGEFGDAGLSVLAILPFIGQKISAARMIKRAEKAGDEVVTLYRGTNWHPSKVKTKKGIEETGSSMVKKGKFIGSRYSQFDPKTGRYDLPEGTVWLTDDIDEALMWGTSKENLKPNLSNYILEFKIPKSELNKLKPVLDKPWNVKGKNISSYGIPSGIDKKWLVKAMPTDK